MFDGKNVPKIIFDSEKGYEDFSAFAWKLASDHITECPGAPQTPYMDEAFAPDRIWIWDTCFMALYCKFAHKTFPGIESLGNFYAPMLDDVKTPLKIHIPDNPPLFAWAEFENFRITGDRERLRRIFFEHRFPQRMFNLFENFRAGERMPYMTSANPIQWEKTPFGYHWSGGRCGMDNTPRGKFPANIVDNDPAYRKVLFLDAAAQQALSAKIIADITGEEFFRQRHAEISDLVNRYYWDEKDACYYDISADDPSRKLRVMTPASYWPLLAGIATPEQARAMAEHAENPEEFGGEIPFPSVARNSKYFDPAGSYWRGGVWLPTAYMAIRALDLYGFAELAHKLALGIVRHQYETWKHYAPHTIWECYSPTERKPSTLKYNFPAGKVARPDFCGWSALGPINLMLEYVLGFYGADAEKRILRYHPRPIGRHGVENFRFGDVVCSVLSDGGKNLSVRTNRSFTLEIDGIPHVFHPEK